MQTKNIHVIKDWYADKKYPCDKGLILNKKEHTHDKGLICKQKGTHIW